jgi:RecJ-like exonuclease
MTMNNQAICPACLGKGKVKSSPCLRCDGSGRIDLMDLDSEELDEIRDLGVRPASPYGWTFFELGKFHYDL